MSDEMPIQPADSTPTNELDRNDTISARNYYRAQIAANPRNLTAYLSLAKLLPVLMERERVLARAQRIAPDDAVVAKALRDTQELLLQGVSIVPVPRIPETVDLNQERADDVIAQTGISTELTIIPELVPEPEAVYCPVHPEALALLRCSLCDKPLCARCATMTAVGQLCDECRLARIPERYKSTIWHAVLTFLFAVGVTGIAVLLTEQLIDIQFIGSFLFLATGIVTGNLVVTVVTRLFDKRGRALVIAAGIGVGVACGVVYLTKLMAGDLNIFYLLLLVMFSILAIRNIQQRLS